MKEALHLPGANALGVVLLHAYTGGPADVNLLAHALNRQGYPVVAPVFAGHEHNDPDALLCQSPLIWWDQVEATVAAMANQTEQVAVFGLSLGGIFAMRALAVMPQVTLGGVIASPMMPGASNVPVNFWRWFKAIRRRQHLPLAPTAAEQAALTQQLAAIEQFNAGTQPLLAGLTKPVFIAAALQDTMIDPQRTIALRAALKRAPVTYQGYEADHVLTVNGAHYQLEHDIEQFLMKEYEGQL